MVTLNTTIKDPVSSRTISLKLAVTLMSGDTPLPPSYQMCYVIISFTTGSTLAPTIAQLIMHRKLPSDICPQCFVFRHWSPPVIRRKSCKHRIVSLHQHHPWLCVRTRKYQFLTPFSFIPDFDFSTYPHRWLFLYKLLFFREKFLRPHQRVLHLRLRLFVDTFRVGLFFFFFFFLFSSFLPGCWEWPWRKGKKKRQI
ncbi:hypothetical protein L873DRAFT_46231 [Choiromyces venosus 120613-1]|uniref:Uncharacterized protein n=1 Tax=Choiromyces venosus 120613-1 TaxID=1336337 RepID=A0A3N4K0C4_9PEZI|nr:hypothetical protein L873DRAFT_46231 [Choiromyces venosus 120613-1]